MISIQQARVFVGQQIGLSSGYDGSMSATNDLPVEQKQALTAALINYIANNPARFTAQQVSVANAERNRAQTLTATGGYSETTFWAEVGKNVENAGMAVASVGQGVVSSVNLIGTLLPIGVLVAVVIFALPYIKTAAK
jgi:uncharacterized protein YllA (UPF0747 family)